MNPDSSSLGGITEEGAGTTTTVNWTVCVVEGKQILINHKNMHVLHTIAYLHEKLTTFPVAQQ